MKKFVVSFLCLTSLMVSGCIYFGAHNLPPDRIRYNKSVVSSDLQQAVLNLVRLRYGDMPNFLSLNNIVSQYTVDTSISADLSRTTSRLSYSNFMQIQPGVNFSEQPTITYTPLQGEEFVTRLMTPVDIKIAKLLLRDGWGIGRVFRTFFQRLGDMPNAVVASRPSSHRLPIYQEFSHFTRILRKLQISEAIKIESDKTLPQYRIKFTITDFSVLCPEEIQFLRRHVGVIPATPDFWITPAKLKLPRNLVAETRTMLSIYSFLSKGVEVPESDYDVAHMIRNPNGGYFDWKMVVGGLIDIKYCRSLPKRAYIYVYYRGYYFYIDDADRSSKEGLNLLMILNGIFQGNLQSVLPVFTIS